MDSVSGTPDHCFQVGLACGAPGITGKEKSVRLGSPAPYVGEASHELALSLTKGHTAPHRQCLPHSSCLLGSGNNGNHSLASSY